MCMGNKVIVVITGLCASYALKLIHKRNVEECRAGASKVLDSNQQKLLGHGGTMLKDKNVKKNVL